MKYYYYFIKNYGVFNILSAYINRYIIIYYLKIYKDYEIIVNFN